MLQNKAWSWVRGAVVIYVFSLFLISGNAFAPSIDFKVPSHFVSDALEREEMTIFFGLTRYANSDEGHLFRYAVDFDEVAGEFILQQNSGDEFRFRPSEWNDASEWSEKSEPITVLSESGSTWQEGLLCDGTADIELSDSMYCEELTFNGKVLYPEEYSKQITDFAFSSDEKWLLLVIEAGAYNPEHVYLLEL